MIDSLSQAKDQRENKGKHAIFAGLLLVFLGLCSLSSYPMLDEGSYLWIAERFSFLRPYDWPLPFPPFDDAFVFAHPPLLLMWISVLQKMGLSGWILKMVAGTPLWFLLGYSSETATIFAILSLPKVSGVL